MESSKSNNSKKVGNKRSSDTDQDISKNALKKSWKCASESAKRGSKRLRPNPALVAAEYVDSADVHISVSYDDIHRCMVDTGVNVLKKTILEDGVEMHEPATWPSGAAWYPPIKIWKKIPPKKAMLPWAQHRLAMILPKLDPNDNSQFVYDYSAVVKGPILQQQLTLAPTFREDGTPLTDEDLFSMLYVTQPSRRH